MVGEFLSAATSWKKYEIHIAVRPKNSGHHINTPVIRKTAAATAIAQNQSFCPALNSPTSSGSSCSSLVAYSLTRRSQRRSLSFQLIGRSQLISWKTNATTKSNPNHGCSNRVRAPDPKTGAIHA